MKKSFQSKLMLAIFVLLGMSLVGSAPAATSSKPTIVLVHGAFADSSSWNGVVKRLLDRGFSVIATANPLRSVKNDADYVTSIVEHIPGQVVLVGHSYGGNMISGAALGNDKVKALVYVAAFAPDVGESAIDLSGKFPGSTLGSALALPVVLPNGGTDLYIQQRKFRSQFAADVSVGEAKLMAASQRPIAEAALHEASGIPAWKTTPSWFIFGTADKNIPLAGLSFMAQRADAKRTVAIEGASHVVMVSHPDAVAKIIIEAAVTR